MRSASVHVDGQLVSEIRKGLLVLLGVEEGDTLKDAQYIADKTAGLRVFEDDEGKMNRSVVDVSGQLLVVSQFTLLGDVRRGKRPSFTAAAAPESANALYEDCCRLLRERDLTVGQGVFQADMQVSLVNDGPVTILLESNKLF